jgi:hypothetical protein
VFLIAAGVGLYLFGGKAVGLMEGNLSAGTIAHFAGNAGFFDGDLITAVSIALAESRGNPHAVGDVDNPGPGDASYGLWQINSHWHPEFGPDFTVLFDPQTNANGAYSIYQAAGYTFQPWSTFKGGQYQAYVAAVQSALA